MHFSTKNTRFNDKKQYSKNMDSKGGFMEFGAMGTTIFYLLMIGAAAGIIVALIDGSDLSKAQQSLSRLNMNIKHVYSMEADYSGLSNASAIQNGIVPEELVKTAGLFNAWGGSITLSANSGNPNLYDISYANVPQNECTKFAAFQAGTWSQVLVNGTDVSTGKGVVSAIGGVVQANNTVTFVSN